MDVYVAIMGGKIDEESDEILGVFSSEQEVEELKKLYPHFDQDRIFMETYAIDTYRAPYGLYPYKYKKFFSGPVDVVELKDEALSIDNLSPGVGFEGEEIVLHGQLFASDTSSAVTGADEKLEKYKEDNPQWKKEIANYLVSGMVNAMMNMAAVKYLIENPGFKDLSPEQKTQAREEINLYLKQFHDEFAIIDSLDEEVEDLHNLRGKIVEICNAVIDAYWQR